MTAVTINESARLAALRRLDLLDTAPEPAFDRIVRLACRVFDVPIALVSLIDADRQWFKARCGLDIESTSRDLAFCGYTIAHDSIFVVPDATRDQRFSSSPLVMGEPFIRFYAGAPLSIGPDLRIGSLCLIDTRPRDFHSADMSRLTTLAHTVVGEVWLRHLERAVSIGLESSWAPHEKPFGFDIEPTVTGSQVRGARGLLNWSIAQLAAAADLSVSTVKRIEGDTDRLAPSNASVRSIKKAFKENGVSFTGMGSPIGVSLHS